MEKHRDHKTKSSIQINPDVFSDFMRFFPKSEMIEWGLRKSWEMYCDDGWLKLYHKRANLYLVFEGDGIIVCTQNERKETYDAHRDFGFSGFEQWFNEAFKLDEGFGFETFETLIEKKELIRAIKLYRAQHPNVDLRTAKQFVEHKIEQMEQSKMFMW